jgi:hypothetical protein
LNYPPGDIDSYLRWYFASYQGMRPHQSNLADQFAETRFNLKYDTTLTKTTAEAVLTEVKRMDVDFTRLEAVLMIERFVFRYKTIGNAHVSPMTDVYLKHAMKARQKPSAYSLNDLRKDLTDLIQKYVPDNVFEANLRARQFAKGRGNTDIRYMLITLEDHHKWYEDGAQGHPKCKDKTRVFDFSATTLEHIYPQSGRADQARPCP